MGMAGGGQGAFIGAVHRMSAALDGRIDLVCGAFSRDPHNCQATGAELGLAAERCYPSVEAMIEAELQRGDDAMECLSIVTPNHLHVPMALSAARAGLAVMSDKPAGVSLAEVETLAQALAETGSAYGLTHTYLGYPMVWQARHLAAQKSFGPVRKVLVEYTQGWLSSQLEEAGNRQAEWRVDPALAGPARP